MKTIAIKVPEELFNRVKSKLVESDQSLTAYIKNLVINDLGLDANEDSQEQTVRTVCFRIPPTEYDQLKATARERGYSIRRFMAEIIKNDLDRELELERFQEEDASGGYRTVAFSVGLQCFQAVKKRRFALGLSMQDYMKTLVYWMTHEG